MRDPYYPDAEGSTGVVALANEEPHVSRGCGSTSSALLETIRSLNNTGYSFEMDHACCPALKALAVCSQLEYVWPKSELQRILVYVIHQVDGATFSARAAPRIACAAAVTEAMTE